MILPIGPEMVRSAPLKPRLSAGVAAAAALAGEPEALADWIVSTLKAKAIREFRGDEDKANRLVLEMLSGVKVMVEFA